MHLVHDPTAVGLHGDFADPEREGDLLVHEAGNRQGHDLLFARTQSLMTRVQGLEVRLMQDGGAAAFDRLADGVEQDIFRERLDQELDRASLHRTHRGGHIGAARDDDDRHFSSFAGHQRLEFEAIDVRETDLQHQAAWSGGRRAVEEGGSAGKGVGYPARGLGQLRQRFPHPQVVIDDKERAAWLDHGHLAGSEHLLSVCAGDRQHRRAPLFQRRGCGGDCGTASRAWGADTLSIRVPRSTAESR